MIDLDRLGIDVGSEQTADVGPDDNQVRWSVALQQTGSPECAPGGKLHAKEIAFRMEPGQGHEKRAVARADLDFNRVGIAEDLGPGRRRSRKIG